MPRRFDFVQQNGVIAKWKALIGTGMRYGDAGKWAKSNGQRELMTGKRADFRCQILVEH